MPLFCYFLGT